MTDIPAIIAGLSAAQRELLIELPCPSRRSYRPSAVLVEKGLAEWASELPFTTIRATPLGLAVRNALIERAAK
jgi:hypothetical protein